jgi:hypothetical protein
MFYMSIIYDSRVVNIFSSSVTIVTSQFEVSLTDDPRGVIYNRHIL